MRQEHTAVSQASSTRLPALRRDARVGHGGGDGPDRRRRKCGATTPVATGHAEVVAQGIVGFPDGTFHWQVADGTLTAESRPRRRAGVRRRSCSPTTGVVDVTAGRRLLPSRRRRGSVRSRRSPTHSCRPSVPAPATGRCRSPASPTPAGPERRATASPWTPGSVMSMWSATCWRAARSTTIPTPTCRPCCSRHRAERLLWSSDGGDSTNLGEGDAATFDGGLTVTNAGPDEVAFVAAVVGPIVTLDRGAGDRPRRFRRAPVGRRRRLRRPPPARRRPRCRPTRTVTG